MAPEYQVQLIGGPEHGRCQRMLTLAPLRVVGKDVYEIRTGEYEFAGFDDPEYQDLAIYEWKGWLDGKPATNPCHRCGEETQYRHITDDQYCGFCDYAVTSISYRPEFDGLKYFDGDGGHASPKIMGVPCGCAADAWLRPMNSNPYGGSIEFALDVYRCARCGYRMSGLQMHMRRKRAE